MKNILQSTEIEQVKGIRERGSVGKSNVAIMAESTVLKILKKEKNQINAGVLKQRS